MYFSIRGFSNLWLLVALRPTSHDDAPPSSTLHHRHRCRRQQVPEAFCGGVDAGPRCRKRAINVQPPRVLEGVLFLLTLLVVLFESDGGIETTIDKR